MRHPKQRLPPASTPRCWWRGGGYPNRPRVDTHQKNSRGKDTPPFPFVVPSLIPPHPGVGVASGQRVSRRAGREGGGGQARARRALMSVISCSMAWGRAAGGGERFEGGNKATQTADCPSPLSLKTLEKNPEGGKKGFRLAPC